VTPHVSALRRHPVKGLTPEALNRAELVAGACFPADRLWAVEVGPSGFDPSAPRHISKMRFAVLARFPALAKLATWHDDASGVFHVGDQSGFGVDVDMRTETGREALARFLQAYLGEEATFRVLEGPGAHRFMDSPLGAVSMINLASVRDLEARIGRPLDPARFRGNILVDGLSAWTEDSWAAGAAIRIGPVGLEVVKPIERCVATHVDPARGVTDIDVLEALRAHFDRNTFGVYLRVTAGGPVCVGDAVVAG
jgi:uncharacterized protein YcbX